MMLRLLQWLFIGHIHQWETIEKTRLFESTKVEDGCRPIGIRYTLRCKCCGDVKARELL